MFPSTSVQIGSSDIEFVKFNNLDSNGKEIFTFSNSGGWLYLGAFILAVLFIITYFLTAFSWIEVGDKIEAADPINPPVKKSTANSYMIMNWVAAGFFILVALFLLYRVFTVKSWRINMERMKQLKEIKETGKKAAIDASIGREADLRLLEDISRAKATLPPDIEAESIEDKVNDLLVRRTTNNSIISNIDEKIKSLNDDYNRAIAAFGPKDKPEYYKLLVASAPRLDEINNEIGKLKKSKDGFLAELRKIEKDLNVARYGSVPIKPVGTKTTGSGITLSAVDKLKQQALEEIKTEKIDYSKRLEPILNVIKDWKDRKSTDYSKAVGEIKDSIPGITIDNEYINGLIDSENTLITNIDNDITNFNLRPDVSLVSASGKIKTLKEQYNILQDIYSKIRAKIK